MSSLREACPVGGWGTAGLVPLHLPMPQGSLMPLEVLLLQALYQFLAEGGTMEELA